MPDLKWLRYGNWCGPGPYPPDDPPAINKVDAACRRHDLGYRQCGIIGPYKALKAALPGGANSCAYKFDTDFVGELKDLIDKGDLKGHEKVAANVINKYFRWKLKRDDPDAVDAKEKERQKNPSLGMQFKKWLAANSDDDWINPA